MRAARDLPDDFYDLYIVDPKHQPIGYVPLSRAMRARRPVKLTDIMNEDLRTVPVAMDQEEVAYLFRQYGLVRSEEHTSELQSLMRISYAVFCLKKKKYNTYR